MGGAEYISQVTRQLQYTAMLGNMDVEMPGPLREFFNIFNVLNVDPALVIGRSSLPKITFRTIFLLIGCCVPMVINVLLLVISKPWYVVLWYWALLCGFLICFVGILGTFLPGTATDNQQTATNLAIVGGILSGIALLAFMIQKIREHFQELEDEEAGGKKKKGDDSDEDMPGSMLSISDLAKQGLGGSLSGSGAAGASGSVVNLDDDAFCDQLEETKETRQEREQYQWAKRFHRKRTLVHMCVTFVLVLVGCVLAAYIRISLPGVKDSSDDALKGDTFFVVGNIILAFGCIAGIYMVMNVFRCGRIAALKAVHFLENNMLRIIVVIVLVSFIPIVSYCLDVYMCTEYDCPYGTKFNPHASRPLGSYTKEHAVFCDSCTFTSASQTTQCQSLQWKWREDHCNNFNERRLIADPTALCQDEGYAYLVVAASTVLATFILGVPSLFFFVTRELTEHITLEAKIVPSELEDEEEREEENWQKRQAAVPAVAGSIYSPFTYRMRYYNLYDLLQRFIFVIFMQVIAPFSTIAAALVLGAHVIFLVILLILKPYAEKTLQTFAVLLCVANVINAALIVALWASGSAEKLLPYAYVAIAVNAVIAIIGGAVLAYLEWRAMGAKEEKFDDEEKAKDRERLETIHEEETRPDFDADLKAELEETVLKARERRIKRNNLITAMVNHTTMSSMSRQFMIMGVIISVSLGFTVLGILREPESPYHVGSNSFYQSTADQIGGFGTWANFTQHCCCATGTAPFDDYKYTERWICDNGKSVTRGRVSADGGDNALPLRSLCNTTFYTGCTAATNTVIDRVEMSCSSTARAELRAAGVNDVAYRLLW